MTLTTEQVRKAIERHSSWVVGTINCFYFNDRTYEAIADELNTAMGGVNPDGLPYGLTISDDGDLLNWRGENYVRQSTLGCGKLTAEHVRKAIRKYAHDDSCYIFEVYGEMCGPIADELNAMMGCESASELIDRARDMARNIQGNLGRNLYRQKDAETLQEASAMLMKLANELDNTIFQLKMARDDMDRFIGNMNEMIDEEVRERLDSR